MPPRRKSRRLAEPTVSDATEVQFVPDPVEIQPQQAVAAFTGEDNRSDTLVSTIVAAVRTAIQSTSAVQPTNVVEAAVQDDVSQIASGSGAFAIKCKTCVNSNSMAECIASEQSVDCASVAGFNADRCVKMSVDYNDHGIQFKSFIKTCYTQELCQQGDRSFQECRKTTSSTCELDCCSGDYCNSDTAPITKHPVDRRLRTDVPLPSLSRASVGSSLQFIPCFGIL